MDLCLWASSSAGLAETSKQGIVRCRFPGGHPGPRRSPSATHPSPDGDPEHLARQVTLTLHRFRVARIHSQNSHLRPYCPLPCGWRQLTKKVFGEYQGGELLSFKPILFASDEILFHVVKYCKGRTGALCHITFPGRGNGMDHSISSDNQGQEQGSRLI